MDGYATVAFFDQSLIKLANMQEFVTGLLNSMGLAWWVEIQTSSPRCVYYFGPFATVQEATEHQSGYVEDLQAEGAQSLVVVIKRCRPTQLTIEEPTEDAASDLLATNLAGTLSS